MKVCHFTSAHESTDDRIYLKECQSLQKAGYEVYIVARGNSFEQNGIKIIGCGEPKSRLQRLFFFSHSVFKKAKSINADIYHFHDPELLIYGLVLKMLGKKVIFDSHEDVPAQILDKKWIPFFFRKLISFLYKRVETVVCKRIDAVVTATDYISNLFNKRSKCVCTVHNYPILDDIKPGFQKISDRPMQVCYAGGITDERGEKIMIKAMEKINADLILAGDHIVEEKENGFGNVKYVGKLNRKEVNELYSNSRVGLVLLKPLENYINSLPIKMFEYMAAGIPFVASNFSAWEKIVDENKCGICVDINDMDSVVNAINELLRNPSLAENMGKNGFDSVKKYYNWENEAEKIVKLYKELLVEEKKL